MQQSKNKDTVCHNHRRANILGMQVFWFFPNLIKFAQILITFAQILPKKFFRRNAASTSTPLALPYVNTV